MDGFIVTGIPQIWGFNFATKIRGRYDIGANDRMDYWITWQEKTTYQKQTATVQTTNHKPLKVPKTSTPNYHHSVGENLAKGSHTATVNVKQQGEGWKVACCVRDVFCFLSCDVEKSLIPEQ